MAVNLRKIGIFLCCLIIANFNVAGQSSFKTELKLSRRNPDRWFSLLVPKIMGKVERKADVDGGFYIADRLDGALEIDYNYWTFENTPNWLRGQYAASLILTCPEKSKNTRTRRTKIDGRRAVIQQCSKTDERKGFRYIYYVTFPKVKVFNGEYFADGMFNFEIEYKNRRYLPVAEKIARSIKFGK